MLCRTSVITRVTACQFGDCIVSGALAPDSGRNLAQLHPADHRAVDTKRDVDRSSGDLRECGTSDPSTTGFTGNHARPQATWETRCAH
ncbi:hypothetical protein Sxan_10750 [Streptomyces xanthophaeus]|uniref:Uncharacterized protein n=1 Tax=Streptomyces xanthophaeus TaxID=67385 RepID=A0A919GVY4_9ACTN|nr:hypothetical protein Sxan_10750 [Streptomyces xanthophaeus]